MIGLVENTFKLSIKYLTICQNYLGEKRIEMLNKKIIDDSQKRKVYSSRNEEICPSYSYRMRIVNRNPLIIYVENLLIEIG